LNRATCVNLTVVEPRHLTVANLPNRARPWLRQPNLTVVEPRHLTVANLTAPT
jgi:hypothetical protein